MAKIWEVILLAVAIAALVGLFLYHFGYLAPQEQQDDQGSQPRIIVPE